MEDIDYYLSLQISLTNRITQRITPPKVTNNNKLSSKFLTKSLLDAEEEGRYCVMFVSKKVLRYLRIFLTLAGLVCACEC